LLRESLEVAKNATQPTEVAYTLVQAAMVQPESGDGPGVGRWLGTAEAKHGATPNGKTLERDQYALALETFRARLGSEAFEAALAEGRLLTLDQAADEALAYLSAFH
jgi:hypothetical protein